MVFDKYSIVTSWLWGIVKKKGLLNKKVFFLRNPHPKGAIVEGRRVTVEMGAIDQKVVKIVLTEFPLLNEINIKGGWYIVDDYEPGPDASSHAGAQKNHKRVLPHVIILAPASTLIDAILDNIHCSELSGGGRKNVFGRPKGGFHYCPWCEFVNGNKVSIVNHVLHNHFRAIVICEECRSKQNIEVMNAQGFQEHLNRHHSSEGKGKEGKKRANSNTGMLERNALSMTRMSPVLFLKGEAVPCPVIEDVNWMAKVDEEIERLKAADESSSATSTPSKTN